MKVDVTIVKRPGVKVDVTLARRSSRRIVLPVKVASIPCADISEPAEELIDEIVEEAAVPFDVVAVQEDDPESCAPCETEDETTGECCDELTPDTDHDPDEDELLALIAEAAAEMDAAGYIDHPTAEAVTDIQDFLSAEDEEELADDICADSAFLDELTEGINDDVLDAPSLCEEEDDEDDTESFFADTVDSSFLQQAESYFTEHSDPVILEEAELTGDHNSAPDAHFLRYFHLNENGERQEADEDGAIGQEIICVDGESGRLSRVCGIIKHGNAQQEDETATDPEE